MGGGDLDVPGIVARVAVSLLVFFHYGIHVLPVVQSVTETLRFVLVRMTL